MKHFINIVGRYVGELHTASSTLAVEEVIDNSSYVVVVLLQQLLIQVAIRDFHAHQPIHEVSGFFRRCLLRLWRCVLLWKLESRCGRSVITTVSCVFSTVDSCTSLEA